jgi:AraC-like DNA-binding protein
VDEIVRPERIAYRAESTPGHLIHVVDSGRVRQRAEGRPELFGGGQVVWYHESEPIEGRILRAPWRFITINFEAPDLAPPPDHRRVLRAGPRTLILARRLLAVWRDGQVPAAERALRCTATLAELLLDFTPLAELPDTRTVYPINARERWWRVEKQLRLRLDEDWNLDRIARLAGMSSRTLNRAARAATGRTPVQRLRELRLVYARGLLQHSDLPVSAIAARIGRGRVQDFSRDFRRRFGQSPREARQARPDYKDVRSAP